MYAKIFAQIYDSSIADDYEVRHFFMDMLVLADLNGHVDMTHEAISARTRIPLDVVRRHISVLEQPDPRSRTREHDGKRLIPIDSERGWGWIVVNYVEYRRIASEEQRREMTKTRTRKWRQKKMLESGDAPVTHCNACDAMQRQKQRHSTTKLPTKSKKLLKSEKELADRLEKCLNSQWVNDAGKWMLRIRMDPQKVFRVLADTELAMKENQIRTTPAQYLEFRWEQFK